MASRNRLVPVLRGVAVFLVIAVMLVLATGIALYRLSLSLPDVTSDAMSLDLARTSIVYAADGSVLARWHGEQDRTLVSLDDVPRRLQDAVLAIEDARFYEHQGVDLTALARAGRANASAGRTVEGGSTITQQLVKLLLGAGNDRTLAEKAREALLAWELEATVDKDAVLQAYLNAVYLGDGEYGVESASRRYFGHPVSESSLAECATLAGIIRSPRAYSPTRDPEACVARRNLVLDEMLEQGSIDAKEHDSAIATPLETVDSSADVVTAPYFVEYVKQQLIDRMGSDAVFRGGLRVQTSLSPDVQSAAEESVRALLGDPDDPEVALVALEPSSGRIVAMVGGRDFGSDQFNLAVQARRQPGSSFKPFVLVRALEDGISPDEEFDATPYSVEVADGVWTVRNYESSIGADRLTLRAATEWSVNCVFARLIMRVGAADVAETARKMGITSEVDSNPAIALGGLEKGVSPLDMASAYATLARGGEYTEPVGIVRVTDDRDETLWEPDATSTRVVPQEVATQATSILTGVVERGTGVAARIPGVEVAGKTGTTQSYRDAWFIGYTKDLSCAVWVGYREGQVAMDDVHGIRVTGGSFPARIWRDFVGSVTIGSADESSSDSSAGQGTADDAHAVLVCPDSMMLANERCPNQVEMYLDADSAPDRVCTQH